MKSALGSECFLNTCRLSTHLTETPCNQSEYWSCGHSTRAESLLLVHRRQTFSPRLWLCVRRSTRLSSGRQLKREASLDLACAKCGDLDLHATALPNLSSIRPHMPSSSPTFSKLHRPLLRQPCPLLIHMRFSVLIVEVRHDRHDDHRRPRRENDLGVVVVLFDCGGTRSEIAGVLGLNGSLDSVS